MSTQQKTAKSAAGTSAKKPAVEKPKKVQAGSRTTRIAELAVGASESSAVRLGFNDHSKEFVAEELDRLRSTMNKAASLASKRSGSTYVTECGVFFTRSGDLVLTAVATRQE